MLPLSTAVAATAALCAGLQLVLARWRDLGPLTIGVGGCAMVLGLPSPGVEVLGAVVVSALLAGAGWARGGRRGVGRPALDGLVLAGAIAGAATVPLLEGRVPLPAASLRAAVVASLALLTLVATGLSLQAPRVGLPPPRWFGAIPIRGPE
jgi:hypothetical protein